MTRHTCNSKVGEHVVRIHLHELIKSIDEKGSLIQIVFILREPPFIDLSAERDLFAWSKTFLDARNGVSHDGRFVWGTILLNNNEALSLGLRFESKDLDALEQHWSYHRAWVLLIFMFFRNEDFVNASSLEKSFEKAHRQRRYVLLRQSVEVDLLEC